ncbi:MAG: sulfite exporter TauE/SafE family protein [Spirochaetota bacterium]
MEDTVIEWFEPLILLGAGLIAGFVNTLAGGGSLLTLPALIFVGLPSPMANATNRVAILMQTTVNTLRFHQKGKLELRTSAVAVGSAVVGAVAGAFIAAELPEEVFDIALAAVLVLVVATLFVRKPTPGEDAFRVRSVWLKVPVFFVIGIYGGFIQAGVGFLLITGITWLLGLDLVRTNATKVLIIMVYSAFALAIFAFYGQVVWLFGLILGVGNMAGGWIGVHFAVKRGAKAVRWVILAAVAASVLDLVGVF